MRVGIDRDFEDGGGIVSSKARIEDPELASKRKRSVSKKKVSLLTTDWVSSFIRIKNSDTGDAVPLTFEERKYLLRLYNTSADKVLFLTSRQTEKCLALCSLVSMADGSQKYAKDIVVGDKVATMLDDGTIGVRTVSWVSEHYPKPGLRVRTCTRGIDVSTTHPLRIKNGWVEAGDLRRGDLVAVSSGIPGSAVQWDTIANITDIGELMCVDFTVEDTHNFIADGFVTHNSTTLGNRILARCNMRPGHSVLFVSPSAMQTAVFSKSRIKETIDLSPMVKATITKGLTDNLLEKHFANGSKLFLRYAFLTADRIRGLSVNDIFADEIQDLLTTVMPVIEETTSHHKETLFVYSGTPKSLDNTINHYWTNSSTMSEWCIPCERHGTPNQPASWHWNILGAKNLGKEGPICSKCGGPINPEHPYARWVEMAPKSNRVSFEGYRICRLMVPWFWKSPKKWKQILEAYERYPTAQFENEVLANSYDSASKPITKMELVEACDPRIPNTLENAKRIAEVHDVFFGIDWGSGNSAYTVLNVGAYCRNDNSFQIIYKQRFTGPLTDPIAQMDEIEHLIGMLRPKFVGADFGFGFYQNRRLLSKYGPARIHCFEYGHRVNAKIKYSPVTHRYLLYRTLVMADVFNALKRKKLRLPKWEDVETPYCDDILSINAEDASDHRMIKYDKTPGRTDDDFHSMLYCLLASTIQHKRPDIFSPVQEKGPQYDAERIGTDEEYEGYEAYSQTYL